MRGLRGSLAPTVRLTTRPHDFVAVVKGLTGGKGVDVILDMVAGDYVRAKSTAWPTTAGSSLIAVLGGAKSEFDAGQVLRRRLTITGSTLRPRPVAFKAAIAGAAREGLAAARSGAVKPVIHKLLRPEQSGAHRRMR